MILMYDNWLHEEIAKQWRSLLAPGGPFLGLLSDCPSGRSCCLAVCQATGEAEARSAGCRHPADPQLQPRHHPAALATTLGMVPSRLVALVDDMEARGLIERRENADDRRRYALHITERGRSTLETIGRVSREHSQALFAAISEDEQRQLATLLERIADEQGLARGVHPGYRQSGRGDRAKFE